MLLQEHVHQPRLASLNIFGGVSPYNAHYSVFKCAEYFKETKENSVIAVITGATVGFVMCKKQKNYS